MCARACVREEETGSTREGRVWVVLLLIDVALIT